MKQPSRIGVALLVVGLFVLSATKALDSFGAEKTDRLLAQAVVTYASTRAVMAVLSVAESVEVGVTVVGVTPGRILRPVTDLLDRFSSVLLYAIVALAMQKFLMQVGASQLFDVLLALTGVLVLVRLWRPSWVGWIPPQVGKAFVLFAFFRFFFVAIALANVGIHALFIADEQRVVQEQLDARGQSVRVLAGELGNLSGAGEVEGPARVPPATDGTWFSRMTDRVNPAGMMRDLRESANSIVDSVITLTVVFLLQAVVVPLGFAWLLWRSLPTLLRWTGRDAPA
ncbi:MAG: hypothetical protein WD081_00270 [Gammaproteobacteria bacterium]